MKKILSLILCLVMACTMLVACDDPVIGGAKDDYDVDDNTVELLELNMYIITGDNTTKTAIDTVASNITTMTRADYSTVLNVHYVTEANYVSEVTAAIERGGKNTPHIILINSEQMLLNLVYPTAVEGENRESGSKLVDLTQYYQTDKYGTLNAKIATALLESSKISGKFFTVPNNRIVGEYTYLVIDKQVSHHILNYEIKADIESYNSLEDAKPLIDELELAGYDPNDFVRVIEGPYELRYELEGENFCKQIGVPTVDSEEAHKSSFAIVDTEKKYNDRAMEIIFALNNDLEFRNLLQYGSVGSNYIIDNGDIIMKKDLNRYEMNILYTGDQFNAYYCSELLWNEAKKSYGVIQNLAAVAKK